MPSDRQLTDDVPLFEFHQGEGPLVISAPHVGTHIPDDIAVHMDGTGLAVGETDFHVHRLFDFAPELGASTLWAAQSRYVIDLNRDPDGHSLYPGKFETPLCPLTDFDRNVIYHKDEEPSFDEVQRRITHYWRPYHAQLRAALDRATARHGYALLIDAHSIRPMIPNLFEGRLPDLNFGTHDGRSCAPRLRTALDDWRQGQSRFSHVVDGRFKGGFTTRHYGRPEAGIEALQIEITQDSYLTLTPGAAPVYDAAIAAPLSLVLRPLVEALLEALARF